MIYSLAKYKIYTYLCNKQITQQKYGTDNLQKRRRNEIESNCS